MNMYNVLDTQTNQYILSNKSSRYIRDHFNKPKLNIPNYALHDSLYQNRYLFILTVKNYEGDDSSDMEPLLTEWTRVAANPRLWKTIDNNLLGEYAVEVAL